jgi:Helicase conserved C-terminal domain
VKTRHVNNRAALHLPPGWGGYVLTMTLAEKHRECRPRCRAVAPGRKAPGVCDSRSQAERLASLLRAGGTSTFVSHSSLSVDDRRQAERAFLESGNCVIVATSTLELGIDAGERPSYYVASAEKPADRLLRPASRAGPPPDSRVEPGTSRPDGSPDPLPSPGACYRALRRLPGQVLHLLEKRVFQDAPRHQFRSLGSVPRRWLCCHGRRPSPGHRATKQN